MSDVLTVYTSFADISELSEGFADRVEDNQIILYGPTAYEEGDELAFRVLLTDESVGLEGAGIVTATYDGGDDRDPEIRYDVVIAGLRLEGLSEVVFERLLVARQAATGEGPPSTSLPAMPADEGAHGFDDDATTVGSLADIVALRSQPTEEAAALDDGPFEEVVSKEFTAVPEALPVEELPEPELPEPEPVRVTPEPPAALFEPAPVRVTPEPPAAHFEPAPVRVTPEPERITPIPAEPVAARSAPPSQYPPFAVAARNVGVDSEAFRGLPPPNAPPVPAGFTIQRELLGDKLGRPVLGSTWQPEARPRTIPPKSDGLFEYGGPVPLPAKPPRPDGLASGHVARAPSPTTEEGYRAARATGSGPRVSASAAARPAYVPTPEPEPEAEPESAEELMDDFEEIGH